MADAATAQTSDINQIDAIKFSIVIPTQNRADLLDLSLGRAMTQDYPGVEVIVSDNSTDDVNRSRIRAVVDKWLPSPLLALVRPERVLGAPEHFEFALSHARGDYVLMLTDKMLLLPRTLHRVAHAVTATGADIVNWTDVSYVPTSLSKPEEGGEVGALPVGRALYRRYDPIAELKIKAQGVVNRTQQSAELYVTGKICFGCFSRKLIDRVKARSGAMFGGATHDYSAMIQGLLNAETCVLIGPPGVLHIYLPRDRSMGSQTSYDSARAKAYYNSFSQPDAILSQLFVPNLYASQHNMVAHDYIKYLRLYGKLPLFRGAYWLRAIYEDLHVTFRLWENDKEYAAQAGLLTPMYFRYPLGFCLIQVGRIHRLVSSLSLVKSGRSFLGRLLRSALGGAAPSGPSTQPYRAEDLDDAVGRAGRTP